MSYELLTIVTDNITTLLAGMTFSVKGEVDPVSMRIHKGALPAPDKDTVDYEDVPFVLAKPGPFSFSRPQTTLSVLVAGAIYTPGDIVAGLQAMDTLLQKLNELKDASFKPYKLVLPIAGRTGDEKTGVQPHPYYHFEMELQFKAPIAGSTT